MFQSYYYNSSIFDCLATKKGQNNLEKDKSVTNEIQDYAIRIAKDIQSYVANGGDITKMNASTVYGFLAKRKKIQGYKEELSSSRLFFLPERMGGAINETNRTI